MALPPESISQLPPAGPLTAADQYPILQGGITKRAFVFPANGLVTAAAYGDGREGLLAAWRVSRIVACTPGVTYIMQPGDTLTVSGQSAALLADQSIFSLPNGGTILNYTVPFLNQQTVSVIAGAVWTVTNASLFNPGDVVKLACDLPLPDYPLNGLMGEDATILSVNTGTNQVTLAAIPYYTYSTSNNCRIAAFNKNVNIDVQIGQVIVPPGQSTGNGAVIGQGAFRPNVSIERIDFLTGTAIRPISDYGGYYELGFVGLGPGGTTGYGIAFSGCEKSHAQVGSFVGGRHAIDSGEANFTGAVGLSAYGASAYNTGSGTAADTYDAPFVSHHGTRQHTYFNCFATNCAGGFSLRGVGNTGRDSRFYLCGQAISAFNQFTAAQATTDQTTFQNVEAEGCTGTIGSFNSGGGNVQIIGGRYSFQGAASRLFEVQGNSSVLASLRMRGGVSVTVGTGSTNRVVAADSFTSVVDLGDTNWEFTSTVPSVFVENMNAYEPIGVRWDNMRVRNPGGTFTSLYGGTVVLSGSGCQFGALVIDHFTNLVNGFTPAQSQPYVTGPIYDESQNLLYSPLVLNDWNTIATPTITFATPGDLTVSYTRQYCWYIYDGSTVTFEMRMAFTPTYTTASGAFELIGVPIGPIDNNGGQPALYIGDMEGIALPAGSFQIMAKMVHPSPTIFLNAARSAATVVPIATTHIASGANVILSISGTYRAA